MNTGMRFAFAAAVAAISFGVSTGQSFAQVGTLTPEPVLLMPNQTVSAEISSGTHAFYRFDVPADQDAVMVMESDKTVLDFVCPVDAPADDSCHRGGGGGNDSPSFRTRLYPATGSVQSMVVELIRPDLDPTTNYRLTVYTMTPQPIADGATPVQESTTPVQVYSIAAHPSQVFTVEAEEERADGDFLWVAAQPYLYESVYDTGNDELPIGAGDASISSSITSPLRYMAMQYVGARQFHLVVFARTQYTLHVMPVATPTLDPGDRAIVNVSYQQPLRVFRLQTLKNDVADVQLDVIKGIGAYAAVYTVGNPNATSKALGVLPNSALTVPLSATIQHPALTNFGSYLVIQVPYEFTRDSASVAVTWHSES